MRFLQLPFLLGYLTAAFCSFSAADSITNEPFGDALTHRPYPLNGMVRNLSTNAILIWSDDTGERLLGPYESSDGFREDVDYVQDCGGLWFKIGPMIATVEADCSISGLYTGAGICIAQGRGLPCIQ